MDSKSNERDDDEIMTNSKRIEEAATTELKSALLKCPILESFIDSNDKTPSWDGYVLVYKNAQQTKADMIGRVPIQIKGTETLFESDDVSFSCSMVDLQNYYIDGGCVFFLVSVDFETGTNRIFFSCLLKDELERLLKAYRNQKTCTIHLNYISSQDTDKIEIIFKSFLRETAFDSLLFTIIDENFLARHRVEGDEANDLIANFSSINGDLSLILKIVCNDLHVHTPAYDRIVEKIYTQTVQSEAPTFLMADGGTGKSTLLCSVANYAYKVHKIQVLYSNYDMVKEEDVSKFIFNLKYFLLNTTGLTLLCIDKSLENKILLMELYKEQAYSHRKNNLFKNLRILVADRTYSVAGLFFSQSDSFSLWVTKSRALLIKNQEQDDAISNSEWEYLKKYFIEEHITILYFNREIQQVIIDEVINRFSNLHGLDCDCVEKAKQNLVTRGKTISDILLDFRRKYNKIAENAARPITKIDWDWDIWNRKMNLMCNGITLAGKIPPKHTFRYIAALILAGTNASIGFLEYITGIALSEEAYELFPEGLTEPVHIDRNGFLRFRHDTVAANYFEINPKPSPMECLKKLIDNELFDKNTLVRFEKKTLSLINIYNYDALEELDINVLLQAFSNHENFRNILAEKERLYSLEIALIAADVEINKQGGNDVCQYYESRLNSSFEYVLSMSPKNARKYYKTNLWGKYFNFAARACATVPPALLRHLADDDYFYKKITEYIESMLESLSVWIPEDRKETLYSCAEIVFQWIIDNINPNDVPGRINLGRIYLERGEYDKAHKLYMEIAALPSSSKNADMTLAHIQIYEDEAKSLRKEDINNPRIVQLYNMITELYQEARQRFHAGSHMYIAVVCRFARFKKEILLFDDAYQLLEELLKEIPAEWCIYNELGMLHNTRNCMNRYYDLKKSIQCFNKAWELLPINSKKKEVIYILKPLAMTYMNDYQFENAIKICDEILKYYKNAQQVKRIKELAQEFLKLPRKNVPSKWWKMM